MGGALDVKPVEPTCRAAISAEAGSAVIVKLDAGDVAAKLRPVLSDAAVPKTIHDYKAAIHALAPLGITLEGVQHDSMLYSYLLDPTYSSHRIADVALRRFNLKLSGQLAEAADITGRLTTALRSEIEQSELLKLYEQIDLPLDRIGIRIDR